MHPDNSNNPTFIAGYNTAATEITPSATDNFSGVAPQPLKSSVAEEH